MKTVRLTPCIALLLLLSAAAAGAGDSAKSDQAQPRNVLRHAIIVTVNGVQITQTDLIELANLLFRQQYGPNPPAFTEKEIQHLNTEFRERAIRELIKMQLIADEAKELNVKVAIKDVDMQLTRMRQNPETASPMLRRFAETELLFDQIMLEQGMPLPKPSPKAIRDFWKKNKDAFKEKCLVIVRSIYLSTDDDSRAEQARRVAAAIHEKITSKPIDQRTALFAAAAKEFSEDHFGPIGGLIRITSDEDGWFPQDIPNPKSDDGKTLFPAVMHRAIRGLSRKGEVTRVLKSERGFHILYLQDIKGGREMPFKEAAFLISRHLELVERRQRVTKWIKEKWERSNVKWHDGSPYVLADLLRSVSENEQQGLFRKR